MINKVYKTSNLIPKLLIAVTSIFCTRKAKLVPHNYTSSHYLCGIKTENYG